MKRFLAVLHARNLEFIRDRSALAWNIILPVVLVFAFAFLFSSDDKGMFKVGVYTTNENFSTEFQLFQVKYIDFVPVQNLDEAIDKIRHHQLDMLIKPEQALYYWVNSTSAKGYLLEQILKGNNKSGEANELTIIKQAVDGKEIRYVDWVLPGILATNMMFSCLFGIGYVIVRYRKNGVLKRLNATPLTAFEFLTAQVISRLILILMITAIVFIGCDLVIDFHMLGSYATLFLVFLLGALSLISLGLLTAARISSEEMSGGVLNVITWPMMLLSGVWFSLEGSPAFIQKLALLLPLTHINNAARAIMNDGSGINQIYPNLLALSVMSLLFLSVGAIMFRWTDEI